MIKLTIPEKIPTLNHLYWHRGNMKILKSEARELRKRIICCCNNVTQADKDALFNKKLIVTLEVYEDWYTKKNEVKKKDLLNREKFLIDSVFEGLGFDDKYIFEYQTKKVQSSKEYAIIELKVLNG